MEPSRGDGRRPETGAKSHSLTDAVEKANRMHETARHLLEKAQRVAVLTGAGISAESGIPTFRDALSGLWARYDPEELATPGAFARNPQLVWDWYAERRAKVSSCEPNAGHVALVELERRVPEFLLITQNVDGLHAAAGSQRMVELHGNIRRVKCSHGCGIVETWNPDDRPPPCPRCRAPLRPDVVWFGEMLPEAEFARAADAARTCEVFLSVGTSNMVEPAASLPWLAHRHGATVIVVNTDMGGQRTGPGIMQLAGSAGSILPMLTPKS
jgi:NAD-dependent deacetylase